MTVQPMPLLIPPWWEKDRGKCVQGCAEGDENCGLNKKLTPGIPASKCAKMEYWEISAADWQA